MNEEKYWSEIIGQLENVEKANRAAHILATGLRENEGLSDTNLEAALKVCSENQIIKGTIGAYRDWSAQPYCDSIFEQFDLSKVFQQYSAILEPGENIIKGIL